MEKPQLAKDVLPPVMEIGPPLVAPHGLSGITDSFGDIGEYSGTDGPLEARW